MFVFYVLLSGLLAVHVVTGLTLKHDELNSSDVFVFGGPIGMDSSQYSPVRGRAPQAHHCPPGYRGTLLQPRHCEWFINCWDGIEHQQPCRQNLNYNEAKRICDFPEKANCCEYWELDGFKLVE